MGLQQFQRGLRILGRIDSHAPLDQLMLDDLAIGGIVIDQQDLQPGQRRSRQRELLCLTIRLTAGNSMSKPKREPCCGALLDADFATHQSQRAV